MKLKIIFLLISNIALCQISESDRIMKEAESAFLNNNFKQAQELYKKVTEIEPKNKDAWYNLAATEIKLNEIESACECFYKVYLLNDQSVVSKIKEFCPNFRNGSIKSISEAQEKPKFIFKDKEYELFEGGVLNPIYLKLLKKEIKKSSILKSKLGKGTSIVRFTINKYGIFDMEVLRISANSENHQIIKNELNSIFRRITKYIPAKHNGENVDLWENWTLPLNN